MRWPRRSRSAAPEPAPPEAIGQPIGGRGTTAGLEPITVPRKRFIDGVTLHLIAMQRERERIREEQGLPRWESDWPRDFGTSDGFIYS